MTKRTPLEKLHRVKLDLREQALADQEKTLLIVDPHLSLSPNERLDLFMALQAWPRIVLGLYRAELAFAQKERETEKKENRVPKTGQPSEIARAVVAEALGLGPDRIRDLCRNGDRHLKQGMPRKPEIRAAEFVDRVLRGQATPQRKRKKSS
jgi:hypothetical protein